MGEYGERRPGEGEGDAARRRRACHGLSVTVAAIKPADRELEGDGRLWRYLTNPENDDSITADEPESLARSEALRRAAREAVTAWFDACL
jgi:hypothetical protein